MKIRIEKADIITNNESKDVLKDGVLHIDGETIVYVGNADSEPEFSADREINAQGNLIMPGFFNTHTHVPMNMFRSYADDLDLMTWLNTRIFPAEDHLNDEIAYWASMAAMCEMAAAGIVGFNEMYFFMDSVAKAAQESGLRAVLSRAVVTPTKEVAERTFREGVELYEKYNGEGRLKVYLSPHAQYTVNNEMLERIAREAANLKTGIHMHISETRGEHENCLKDEGKTPVGLCAELGLLDVPFLAAHCVWISPQDMELMARHGSYVLSCPRSNLKLASGIAPLTAMLEKGVNVSLGTDGVASNNKLSMMEEMTYAALLQKGTTYNPQAIPAAQAIDMATRQGAKAMGFKSGVIEAGKNADIIMLNTAGIRYTPDYDIVSNVVYSADDTDVCMTMVGGEIIYENGRFSFADIEEVKRKLDEYADIMKAI